MCALPISRANWRELAMAHWLFKSEPSAWSYEKVAGLGAAGTDWSGVRNHTAKLNMQAMKVGEQGFFYHSNEGKAVVGIVEVCKAYRPDPTDATGKFGMVDFFDVNDVGSDSHLQFMNWAIDQNGAYDFAADTRGYTWGAIVEYQDRKWGFRFAEALMPSVANGINLVWNLRRARAENYEF